MGLRLSDFQPLAITFSADLTVSADTLFFEATAHHAAPCTSRPSLVQLVRLAAADVWAGRKAGLLSSDKLIYSEGLASSFWFHKVICGRAWVARGSFGLRARLLRLAALGLGMTRFRKVLGSWASLLVRSL